MVVQMHIYLTDYFLMKFIEYNNEVNNMDNLSSYVIDACTCTILTEDRNVLQIY